MVISMTGFGRSKSESNSISVNVEIKTVNHRFNEINIRMPRQLLRIEDKIKKKLNQYIRRGRVEVYVTIDGESIVSRKIHIDWKLMDDYYLLMKQVQEKYAFEGIMTLQDLLNKSDLIHIEECELENEELEQLVLSATEDAVKFLKQMRTAEGEELKKDLLSLLTGMDSIITELLAFVPLVAEAHKERLTKRMMELANGQIDESRLLTELAVFADKADINEEITRLKSHMGLFLQTLNESDPIGRKLDFLVQEMNREANTIGSKGNDFEIAQKVVEVKSLLEKIKEQVQNIE